jgi:hypothetical protein
VLRHAVDIGLDGPVVLQIQVGVYVCPKCRQKPRSFRTPLDFLGPRKIYVMRCHEKLVEAVNLDKMAILGAAARMKRDFHIPIVPSTAWEWYHESPPGEAVIGEYQHLVVASFSGVLAVDEVYDGQYGILCARDPLNDRTIAYELCEKVNQEAVIEFFRRLKAMGIDAQVVVSDDSNLYPKAIKAVWAACKHQLCRFHWTKGILAEVARGIRGYRNELPSPPKRAKRGRPKKDEAASQAAADAAKAAREEVRKGRYILVQRREHMDDDQAARLAEVVAHHPPLAVVRAFVDQLYGLFDGKPRASEARWRRRAILADEAFTSSPYLAGAITILQDEAKFEKVATFLAFQNLVSTSNDVERDNRGFRKHQKAHYRFRSKESIQILLDRRLVSAGPPITAEQLKRRFGNPNWIKKKVA